MLDNPNTTFPPVQLEVDLIIRESAWKNFTLWWQRWRYRYQ
jgi:hypothetical protein